MKNSNNLFFYIGGLIMGFVVATIIILSAHAQEAALTAENAPPQQEQRQMDIAQDGVPAYICSVGGCIEYDNYEIDAPCIIATSAEVDTEICGSFTITKN